MVTKAPSFWATVGDIAHAISLVNVIAFAYTVGFHREVFDASWREEGFCVMNPDLLFWTSHDLCLYCDVGLAAVLAVLVFLLQGEPDMQVATQTVKPQLWGIVGHGIGHGAIARILRHDNHGINATTTEDYHQSDYEAGNLGLSLASIPFLVFWILLLRSALPKLSWSTLAVLAVQTQLLQQFFPPSFGFTYVQSVLMMAFAVNEMILKPASEKGFEYGIFPWIVAVPLTMISWLESTLCSKVVVRLGGHLIYDAYIPLAIMWFYMICWLKATLTAGRKATPNSSRGDEKTKVA